MSAESKQSAEQATPPIGWCPMCQQDVAAWVPGPNGRANAQCPHCESLERNRLLILALGRLTDVFATATTLLDVAPTPGVDAALVRKVGEDRYVGFDLGLDNRDVKVLGDLSCMPFQDRSVDVLVAFHVLEHVPDDAAAMREIRRVLGDTGVGLVQVPIAAGPTDEDPNASIEERIQRFGRHDHVRQYGDDWEDRLRDAGLGVARFLAGREFTPDELRRANTHGRFWLVTGVADDSGAPAAMISAVIERRRAVGLDPAEAGLPSADARARESELRVMRRRARRAEADFAAVRSGPVARVRATVSRAIGVVRERGLRKVVAAVPSLARDSGRLVRRLRG